MKRKLKQTALVACSTVLALLLAEGVLRALFPSRVNLLRLNRYVESERAKFARYDEKLGWDGLPEAEDDIEWMDARHHVRHNRFGYRGGEYEHQRTDRRRVAALGDSFLWGFGVAGRDIFTSVMERRAAAPLEVVNLGVSGYGTDQMLLLWQRKGRLWRPDDVLLMFTVSNDLWDNLHPERYGYPKPVFRMNSTGGLELTNVPAPRRGGSADQERAERWERQTCWVNAATSHSALANVGASLLARNPSMRDWLESRNVVVARKAPQFDWESGLYATPADEQTETAWEILFKLLAMLKSDVEGVGAKLRVAIIPSVVQVYPDMWERFCAAGSPPAGATLDPETPNRRLASWCRDNGVAVTDLLPALRRAAEAVPYLYYPINNHWTSHGHRVVADVLLNDLGLAK